MNQPRIQSLYTYPLKSAGSVALQQTQVGDLGFAHDREFALVNAENKILTAREKPQLLQVEVALKTDVMGISAEGTAIEIPLNAEEESVYELELFKKPAFGKAVSGKADEWFSGLFDEPLRLVRLYPQKLRQVSAKYALNEEHPISFADGFPIHLISEASVVDLNTRLEQPLPVERFRPNIVTSGVEAYAEETWKQVIIGDCIFDVITATPRCSLITIKPEIAVFDSNQEPLRSLFAYKKEGNQINFGVYLIPKTTGMISLTDSVHLK
ncbi:MOSC domain-containing protein [Leeuwenhoekiella parthenopeia]|uniref:MOSC domain-containing protein n=1 Tax=Leeuwenhoekiella parthenopeia TaxID=2890320 RepID=A0ABS8GQ88_9FLAO|nr:MOSC N-terminal beta barrel domain-containing protein [Leeuwenhoekiella parthenopeia]MCC4212149.1 MOSC domain-containing protein [Leeuwenhoekiella parthenopeia]